MKNKKLEELMRLSSLKKDIIKQSDFFKNNNIKDFKDDKFHNFISKKKKKIPKDKDGFIDFEKLDDDGKI